jgi:hypothetical protein
MTALPGWPAVSGAATFQHIRRSLAGTVVKSAAGVLRKGILPISTAALVTGTATMNVAVGAFVAVLDRNGAVFLPNDGSVNVLLSSAPASGSRWSVVYVKQKETDAPFSDGSSGPVIDKVESTSSAAAARASLPDGALEIALVKVDAGSANTNAVGVTITQTAPYTAMEGGVVLLRDSTDQSGWAPHDGSVAYRIDTNAFIDRVGGDWSPRLKKIRTVAGTASGALSGSTWLNLAPQVTIPASPFGVGIAYSVRVYAISNATLSGGNTYAIRVLVDGSLPTISGQAQAAGTGGISVDVEARQPIASPNATHTVDVQILAVTGTATVVSGASVSYFIVELERVDTF